MKIIILFVPLALLICLCGNLSAQGLAHAEYFYDTDPGTGNGTAISITTPGDSINETFSPSIGGLSTGTHFLYVRFQDSTGIWGLEMRQSFFVATTNVDTGSTPNIIGGEYFFDTDPGNGNGTFFAAGPADSVNNQLAITINGLNGGFHFLYTRYQYANGIWGLALRQSFFVAPNTIDTTTNNTPLISKAEYFFDTDPGNGNGTAITVVSQSDSENIPFIAPIGGLSPGAHYLYTRFGYTNGSWGLSMRQSFFVTPVQDTSPPIAYAEYFFDTDPGVGNGTSINVGAPSDSVNLMVNVSTAGLGSGRHILFMRFQYTNGVWGLYQPQQDTVIICSPPVDHITANGSTNVCVGNPVTLISDTASTWHYQWQRNGVNLQGDTFSTLTITDSGGIYDVVVVDSGCPGTSDSIVVTINYPTSFSYSQSICQGQSVQFGGNTLTTGGTYRDTVTNAAGCDSVITLTLTVSSGFQTPISVTICSGDSYSFNGQNLTTAGTYYDTLTAGGGCDSVIVLTLSVSSISPTNTTASICQGNTYFFNGQDLGTAGTYYDTLLSVNGCDSIIVLALTVNNPTFDTISAQICQGQSYQFNESNLTVSGTYHETLTNNNGCDSNVTLLLQVLNVLTDTFSTSICNGASYNFNGTTLTIAGIYSDTLTSAGGCDSVVTVVLSMLPSSFDTISASICTGNSYSFNEQNITFAGTYSETLTAANGCDSIVTLVLTVDTLPNVTWGGATDTVFTNSSPVNLTGGSPAGGTYSGTGVSNSVFYPDSAGIGTFNLTYNFADINGCANTATRTYVVIISGIEDIGLSSNIQLYPNPATDMLIAKSDIFSTTEVKLIAYDVTGKAIALPYTLQANQLTLNTAALAGGAYYIQFNINGALASKRFIKIE